jgi:hypothetical protein
MMSNALKTTHLMYKSVYRDGAIFGLNDQDFEREKALNALLFMYLSMIFMNAHDLGLDERKLC